MPVATTSTPAPPVASTVPDNLLDRLIPLPSPDFEEIVFRLDWGASIINSGASQKERAIDLMRVARSRTNGEQRLWEVYQEVTGNDR